MRPKIAVVCHGNILRSQVLGHYVRAALDRREIGADVFSCGIAPRDAYPNEDELLQEVQEALDRRGVEALVKRTWWSPGAVVELQSSEIVLVADRECKRQILRRTGMRSPVYLFYEFIGEGTKDFVDTFDRERGKQDPDRFARSFDELERIAGLVADQLETFCGGQ